MSKREKIILLAMALTVLVGGYVFFFDSKDAHQDKPPTFSLEEAKAVHSTVEAGLAKSVLDAQEKYILRAIQRPWDRDPFRSMTAEQHEEIMEAETPGEILQFTYSAYVEVGDHFVAVINSREYETGDMLAEDGYRLVRVDAKSALIKGPGESTMIVVPYQEYVRDD